MKSSTLHFTTYPKPARSFQRQTPPSPFCNSLLKRLFDIAFSLSALVLLFPLFSLIALAIRLSSQGNVIYTQARLGKEGRVFKCYKFRTMHPDADATLAEILQKDPAKRLEWEQNQKLRDDPRIFFLGHLLRKTSLDELPQFWNVLRGDLSIVGPRPYMVTQKESIGQMATTILAVRPGITGLWQTSGRSSTTFHQRIILDARYVESTSFSLDLLLILKTIPHVLFAKNAY